MTRGHWKIIIKSAHFGRTFNLKCNNTFHPNRFTRLNSTSNLVFLAIWSIYFPLNFVYLNNFQNIWKKSLNAKPTFSMLLSSLITSLCPWIPIPSASILAMYIFPLTLMRPLKVGKFQSCFQFCPNHKEKWTNQIINPKRFYLKRNF